MNEKNNQIMDNLSDKLNDVAEKANMTASAALIQLETMAGLQKDERMEIQKMHKEEIEILSKRHHEETEAMRKHYGKIIFGLIATLIILLSIILGGGIYLFSNYDFATLTYQEVDGQSMILDGIHFSSDSE